MLAGLRRAERLSEELQETLLDCEYAGFFVHAGTAIEPNDPRPPSASAATSRGAAFLDFPHNCVEHSAPGARLPGRVPRSGRIDSPLGEGALGLPLASQTRKLRLLLSTERGSRRLRVGVTDEVGLLGRAPSEHLLGDSGQLRGRCFGVFL